MPPRWCSFGRSMEGGWGGNLAGELGLIGFVFSNWAGVVFSRNALQNRRLCWFWRCGNWVCFAKNRAICRGVSTSVEGGSWPLRHKGTKRQTDRGFGNAKIKMQSAKLRQPDVVGMATLIFIIEYLLFTIDSSYMLDVYYTRLAVGCQVNFLLTTDFPARLRFAQPQPKS